MGKIPKIPPVKINWNRGFNTALIYALRHARDEAPAEGIHFDSIINNVRRYGRVKTKEDGSGEYDSLYLYENEAAEIIHALMRYIIDLNNRIEGHFETMTKCADAFKTNYELLAMYDDALRRQQTALDDYQNLVSRLSEITASPMWHLGQAGDKEEDDENVEIESEKVESEGVSTEQ